jgi:hypothetical protein
MLPTHLIDHIFSFLPPTLNICLVSKSIKKERKPVTFLSLQTIQTLEDEWHMLELTHSIGDAPNALELCIWVCLQEHNFVKAQQYIDLATTKFKDDGPRLARIHNYSAVTFGMPQNAYDYDYITCVQEGNVALLMYQDLIGNHRPIHFTFLKLALSNQRILLATYMMRSTMIHLNYEDYEIFIANANGELVKWLHRHYLYRADQFADFLQMLKDCNHQEALAYFDS